MSFLKRLFGRDDEDEDVPITLDLDRRRPQLLRLEKALDALAKEMRADHTTDDPGWRGRVNEYSRLAGDAMTLRKGTPTRDEVLDLVFEVRPCFTGPLPAGMEKIGPLQDEVIAAAADLRQLLPGEKKG
ncbi:MAG TPA: hypothetical protein VE476_06345 [Propionibacteriaceae bacterium]|jgi:hypothetical protein|nr:hypothetical protein [Propionibacteriaceae bacterium]